MMDDLIAFLSARLDADERAATAARDEPDSDWWWSEDAESAPERHIARHRPTQVLADVAAKRRLIEEIVAWEQGDWAPWAESFLQILAMPYANHQDYREEWRP